MTIRLRILSALVMTVGLSASGSLLAADSMYSPPDTALLDATASTLTPAAYIENPGTGLIDDYTLMQPAASGSTWATVSAYSDVTVTYSGHEELGDAIAFRNSGLDVEYAIAAILPGGNGWSDGLLMPASGDGIGTHDGERGYLIQSGDLPIPSQLSPSVAGVTAAGKITVAGSSIALA